MLRVLMALSSLLPAGYGAGADARANKRRFAEVNSRLEQKKKEIERYRALQKDAQGDLERLEREKRDSERALRELEVQSRRAEFKTKALSAEVGAVARAHDQGSELMAEELREYRRGLPERDLAGKDGLWEDAFRRAAIREKSVYVARLQVFHQRASAAQAEARLRDRRLKAEAREALESLRTRKSDYEKRREDYREVEKKLSRTMEELRELEETKKALASLLEGLRARKRARPAGAAPRMAVPRHSLPWPVAGKVTSRFGKEQVASLGTWIIRNGIEVAAEPGALVRPVGVGRVIFTGPFRSYGNLMIVEHATGYHSVYGRLGTFLKRKGEEVTPASPIALLGSEDGRGTLYLEIRQDGDALDPLSWLQERQP